MSCLKTRVSRAALEYEAAHEKGGWKRRINPLYFLVSEKPKANEYFRLAEKFVRTAMVGVSVAIVTSFKHLSVCYRQLPRRLKGY
jgi:hypothetical protein